jgi:hypothetical protein
VATVDEDLSQLEKDIRQLQIEYETYFAGGRSRPPADTEWRVQRTIKRYAEMGGKLKYAERFRFNNLTSRYAKYSEIWRRRTRKVEAGQSAYSYSKTARELDKQRLEEAERRHEAWLRGDRAQVAMSDPRRETEQVQTLYHKMIEAKKAAGEASDINFEQFSSFVRSKTKELRQQMHCDSVQFEISLEGGHVKLKAKGL